MKTITWATKLLQPKNVLNKIIINVKVLCVMIYITFYCESLNKIC